MHLQFSQVLAKKNVPNLSRWESYASKILFIVQNFVIWSVKTDYKYVKIAI